MLKDLKKRKKYPFIASESLSGVTLKHIFIPMGAINEVKMYPMDFEEFFLINFNCYIIILVVNLNKTVRNHPVYKQN